jgi:peptide/nickel transport system substrate-binding protein
LLFSFRPGSSTRHLSRLLIVGMILILVLAIGACSIPGFFDDDVPDTQQAPEQSEPVTEPADPESEPSGEIQQQVPDEAFQIDTASEDGIGTELLDIVEGGLREPRTLNPVLVDDPLSEELSGLIFSGLTRIDPDTGEPEPDLAQEWDLNEEETIYTFTIREELRWHDGQPVTAQDVEFTFELMMDFRTQSPRYSRIVERVAAVEAIDTQTVEVRLISPYAPFLSTIATFGIVPQHLLMNVIPDELVAHPFGVNAAVGTGPFRFAVWTRGDQIIFEANLQHYRQPPSFDRYIYRLVPDAETLASQLEQETIDWARITPAQYEEFEGLSGVDLIGIPGYEMISVVLQLDVGQTTTFQDVELRRALLHAIDREALIEDIWHGEASIAHSIIPAESWASAEPRAQYTYDPDRARELLDNAGWTVGENGIRQRDGQPARFLFVVNGDNPARRDLAEQLVEQWSDVGIEAEVTFETWGDVRDRITNSREFEALLFGYRWDIDPDQHAMWSSDAISGAFNLSNYVSEDVDRLLDSALATSDRTSRELYYAEIQEIVLQDLPVLPLTFPNQLVAVGQRLQDTELTAILLRNRSNVAVWQPASTGANEETDDE